VRILLRALLPLAYECRVAVRKAVLGMMAMKRMSALASHGDPATEALTQSIARYKEESEKEVMEVRLLLPLSPQAHRSHVWYIGRLCSASPQSRTP
jgi:hypothetical protein